MTTENKEAEIKAQEHRSTITRLFEKRAEYVQRLDIGAAKIEEARSQGRDVTLWEDYWIQLLRQYEAVCDKMRDIVVSDEDKELVEKLEQDLKSNKGVRPTAAS